MSAPRVLDVGNCSPDHQALRGVLERHFGAQVEAADSGAEAIDRLRNTSFDLVLVNRVFDADGSDGLGLIQSMQADSGLASIPVMLVTNFPDHQQRAIEQGALPGFGKRELGSAAMLDQLRPLLESQEKS